MFMKLRKNFWLLVCTCPATNPGWHTRGAGVLQFLQTKHPTAQMLTPWTQEFHGYTSPSSTRTKSNAGVAETEEAKRRGLGSSSASTNERVANHGIS